MNMVLAGLAWTGGLFVAGRLLRCMSKTRTKPAPLGESWLGNALFGAVSFITLNTMFSIYPPGHARLLTALLVVTWLFKWMGLSKVTADTFFCAWRQVAVAAVILLAASEGLLAAVPSERVSKSGRAIFGWIGGRREVPGLIAALGQEHSKPHALVSTGAAAVPLLMPLLHGDESDMKFLVEAVGVLGEIGAPAAPALPKLLALLEKGDQQLLTATEHAVVKIGKPAMPRLIELLGTPKDSEAGRFAGEVLGRIGPPAVPLLLDTLERGHPDAKLRAAVALGNIGTPAAPAATKLKLLFDETTRSDVKYEAALAIHKILPPSRAVVPYLIHLLQSGGEFPEASVADALARVGSPAVPDLILVLKRQDATSLAAARVLTRFGARAAPAARDLASMLEAWTNGDSDVAEALVSIGRPAVPHVTPLLRDPNRYSLAMSVLKKIGPAAAVATDALLSAELPVIDRSFHDEAQNTIRAFGPAAMPYLLRHLEPGDPACECAARLLAEMGNVARRALPALVRLLGAAESRYFVQGAIERFGESARPYLESADRKAHADMDCPYCATLSNIPYNSAFHPSR